jgi:hypothetical protein
MTIDDLIRKYAKVRHTSTGKERLKILLDFRRFRRLKNIRN